MESLNNILFIDIETVPIQPELNLLSEPMQILWGKKSKISKFSTEEELDPSQLFNEKAGIFSEFAKVVCIGLGVLQETGEGNKLRLKAIADRDEKVLLSQFLVILNKFYIQNRDLKFCGHNIKEFDIPFLCRRLVVNELMLPDFMQLQGKKPWEVNHIDTMELWKFGDHKHFTSLALLAEILGIPSPKDDIDGSMVSEVFWNENNLERISRYCMQDVLTSAKVYLKLKGAYNYSIEPLFT